MTSRDFESFLRRALREAAGSIEPPAGGLERIKARLRRPRPVVVAWAGAIWTVLAMRTANRWQAGRFWLREILWATRDQFGLLPRAAAHGRARSSAGWMRLLVAVGTAVFVVAAGTYAAIKLPHEFNLSNTSSNQSSTGPNGSGKNTTNGHPGSQSNSSAPLSGTSNPSASSPTSTGCPTKLPVINPGPSSSSSSASSSPTTPSPSNSSPSPTPPPSSSGSPSPTPTASGGTGQANGSTPSPGASSADADKTAASRGQAVSHATELSAVVAATSPAPSATCTPTPGTSDKKASTASKADDTAAVYFWLGAGEPVIVRARLS